MTDPADRIPQPFRRLVRQLGIRDFFLYSGPLRGGRKSPTIHINVTTAEGSFNGPRDADSRHDSYVDCLGGGYRGYQAACWDCDWRGPEHLRGDEEMGTPESRAHKSRAKDEANQHRVETRP